MLLEQGQRVKSKVKPVYDFATLQQACYPDWSLHIDTAVATAGYAWIARAAPTICYGVDKSNRWYMQWAGQLLDACQRFVDANPKHSTTVYRLATPAVTRTTPTKNISTWSAPNRASMSLSIVVRMMHW